MEKQHAQFLIGQRLYLRPIEQNDIDRCYVWMNDRAVTRTLLRHIPIPHGAQNEWIQSHIAKRPTTGFTFAIVLNSSNEHIGNCGIEGIDWIDRTGTTGWVIGAKECWGQGYATEAVMLLLHYGFTGLNLRKITSAIIADNIASNRVHEKCGYREAGRYRKQFFRDGVYIDEILFELFAEDFMQVWEQHRDRILPTL
ncbi:MAG: GNAT family N-acetyltransferase [bacterium]|nr:GNAT family N-acetyltransferase [bacterium]